MFKPTLFIAVKCCQCSTMQVKQQKKSSNKWNCVVCNQKQSVTKIYAQGYQAKDIRAIVQSFNMSRKAEDELQQGVPSLGHFVEQVEGIHQTGESTGKRRTDWSEYVEDDENVEPDYLKSKLYGKGMATEAKVVTEISEDLFFKKPRLKGGYGSSSSSIRPGKDQSYKPNFSNRGSTREIIEIRPRSSNVVDAVWDECIVEDSDVIRDVRKYSEQQGHNKVLSKMKTGASKWSQYSGKDDSTGDSGRQSEPQLQLQQPKKSVAMMKVGASKWSEYITDDDDAGGGDKVVNAAFADDLRLMSGYKLENDGFDQLIEEDIHPDFM